jgi:hypothetical protein
MSAEVRLFDESARVSHVQEMLPFDRYGRYPNHDPGFLTRTEGLILLSLTLIRWKYDVFTRATNREIGAFFDIGNSAVSDGLASLQRKGMIRLVFVDGQPRLIEFTFQLPGDKPRQPVQNVEGTPSAQPDAPHPPSRYPPSAQTDAPIRPAGTPHPPSRMGPIEDNSKGNSKREEEKKQNAREIVDAGDGTPSPTPAKNGEEPLTARDVLSDADIKHFTAVRDSVRNTPEGRAAQRRLVRHNEARIWEAVNGKCLPIDVAGAQKDPPVMSPNNTGGSPGNSPFALR